MTPGHLADLLWVPHPSRDQDLHVGFRGRFSILDDKQLELHMLGSTWYAIRLDGEFLADGPPRFDDGHPEYSVLHLTVPAGRHVLTAHVHHLGVATRLAPNREPFLHANLIGANRSIPLDWRCLELPGYNATGRRSSPLFGWLEWVDTRTLPEWHSPEFEDSAWLVPEAVDRPLGPLNSLQTDEVRYSEIALEPYSNGFFTETMPFFDLDDPPVRFLTSSLDSDASSADGEWRRYDLGRVRLGTPRLTVTLEAGAVVEMGSAERLVSGRVAPVYPGSTGPTCNIDHFTARGGTQVFQPLHPRGMRFLEVHVRGARGTIDFVNEAFIERSYFDRPLGSLQTEDPVLDRIWSVSIDTLRACSEDALVDCPTRERGQWLGDVATVGLEIAAVAYPDLRLVARGLRQSVWSPSAQGVGSGLSPGSQVVLSTYALQAITAGKRYLQMTGDRQLLRDLYPGVLRCLTAFQSAMTPDGLDSTLLPPSFVDWGYVPPTGPTDMALDLHTLLAFRDLDIWADAASRPRGAATQLIERLEGCIKTRVDQLRRSASPWNEIGYHCTALALRAGLVPGDAEPAAVEALKTHILNCFPNDPSAPRHGHPMLAETRVITPYFTHYVFPELIQRDEMDFVLDQFRRCWGWMLEQGATTWLEVFDTRWSHCHLWSGSPAWLMSRYLLGLWPRFDRGPREFDLCLSPGSLGSASGSLPLPTGEKITVSWSRQPHGLSYSLTSDCEVTIRNLGGSVVHEGCASEFLVIPR